VWDDLRLETGEIWARRWKSVRFKLAELVDFAFAAVGVGHADSSTPNVRDRHPRHEYHRELA
jgi:hypothetical protein